MVDPGSAVGGGIHLVRGAPTPDVAVFCMSKRKNGTLRGRAPDAPPLDPRMTYVLVGQIEAFSASKLRIQQGLGYIDLCNQPCVFPLNTTGCPSML